MKLSFKFRIALISLGVSGTLLTVFGIIFFAFAYQAGLDRMDRELRTLAEASLHGARPPQHWQNLDQSLQFIYGKDSTERIVLLVTGFNDHIEFISENAPPELAALPRPQKDMPSYERRPPPRRPGPRDGEPLPENPARRARPDDPPPTVPTEFQTLQTASGNWRVGQFNDPQLTITIALDMETFYAEINRFRNAFVVSVPLGLLLLGFTGWLLAGRAMKPVAVIANTAEGITAKGLDQRIPRVGNNIELERLVTVSNDMLDRLEKSYHQAVRFSADAAHELQTPLTILQGELDNAIQTAEDGSAEQQRYSMLLEELCNLKAVVQKLLLLSHADEGRLNLNPVQMNLSELIREAAEDIEIMGPGLEVQAVIEDGVQLSADPALLNQILRNMTSNAAKYSEDKGRVVFTLRKDKHTVHFTLANAALPIPEEDRPLLFERFHRVDKARTTTGSGLGLSLAREIARAHGGDLVLNPYSNEMVSFTLTIPAM